MIRFQSPATSIGDLGSQAAAELIAASADVAVVIDAMGVVRDVALSADLSRADPNPVPNGHPGWVGRRFVEIVTAESRGKVEEMIADARPGQPPRPPPVKHPGRHGPEKPKPKNARSHSCR